MMARAGASPHPAYRALQVEDGSLSLGWHAVRELERHAPSILLRPLLAGVCSADLKELRGLRATRHDLGHEIVARVVRTLAPEALPLDCLVCLNPNLPIKKSPGFSELMLLEGDAPALLDSCRKIPAGMALTKAVFAEPLSCAWNCVETIASRRAPVPGRDTRLAVVGASTFGVLIALLAARRGYEVSLFNRSQARVDFVRARLPSVRAASLAQAVDGQANAFDVVVLATSFCTDGVIAGALPLLRHDGLLHLFGGTVPDQWSAVLGLPIDALRRAAGLAPARAGAKPLSVSGSYDATPADFERSFELLADAGTDLPVEALVSQEIGFAALPGHLRQAMASSPIGKTLVRMDGACHA